MPGSVHELVSVGDDNAMLLWDTRTGTAPAARADRAHGNNDLHCVDWSKCDTSYIATGRLVTRLLVGISNAPLWSESQSCQPSVQHSGLQQGLAGCCIMMHCSSAPR